MLGCPAAPSAAFHLATKPPTTSACTVKAQNHIAGSHPAQRWSRLHLGAAALKQVEHLAPWEVSPAWACCCHALAGRRVRLQRPVRDSRSQRSASAAVGVLLHLGPSHSHVAPSPACPFLPRAAGAVTRASSQEALQASEAGRTRKAELRGNKDPLDWLTRQRLLAEASALAPRDEPSQASGRFTVLQRAC